MKQETRALRGAAAGSENAFLAVRIEEYASSPQPLQVQRLTRRFGLSATMAEVIAALAYSNPEKSERRV